MFRFLELELHGWDLWHSFRVPLDSNVVVLSGPNGSGKTTMLDAVRQLLHAPRLSQNRRLAHYLRQPNRPALLRAVVSNRADNKGRRPFDRQQIFADEATLACALVPNGGTPEKRYTVLSGRAKANVLQEKLLASREWLGPDEYRRVLEYAGVSRSLLHILALEQGRADELSHQKPRELFRWVMEARGSQQVLERYSAARRLYEDSVKEVTRQNQQRLRCEADLASLDRAVRRLDEYKRNRERVKNAEAIAIAARLQVCIEKLRDIDRKLPELRTKKSNLLITIDRLQRETSADEEALRIIRSEAESCRERAKAAIQECDAISESRGGCNSAIQECTAQAAELSNITAENINGLGGSLDDARNEFFRADQQRTSNASALRDLEARMSDLEKGIRRFPQEVEETLSALAGAGIQASILAPRAEILDATWSGAIESALGPLRYAICVVPSEVLRSMVIARSKNFIGPIVSSSDTTSEAVVAGPLKLGAGIPRWLEAWGASICLADEEFPGDAAAVRRDGTRHDQYGFWVSQVFDRVLGGNAVREQMERARQKHAEIQSKLDICTKDATSISERIEDLQRRLSVQQRRQTLATSVSRLLELEEHLVELDAQLQDKKNRRDETNDEVLTRERDVNRADNSLQRKRDELGDREKELEGTRVAVEDMESNHHILEPEIESLRSKVEPDLMQKAQASNLPSQEMAERDLTQAKEALAQFEQEGPLPEESVREEKRMLELNLNELVSHVRERQEEADAARIELDQCRGDYLDVIRSTLHDYSRRARGLAELASAKIEVELPQLENSDRSVEEAGIVVRIGFDGKPPTELGDTSHSGGQQVIAGLVLLMSMAETEGDSFFLVDEPFAHLSLDRVDDVGKFLRRSGAQFLITVPTTLDRGQLDPASLLIVLSNKAPIEPYAPLPIVARA